MTILPPRGSKAMAWVTLAFAVIGVALVTMGMLAYCAQRYHWEGFWRSAGQPFATVIAGMAALAAGALALYNGERQRASDIEKWASDRAADRDKQAQLERQWEAEQRAARHNADRQHRREVVRELRSRFTTATSQLADPQATVRRSGAYAMAALANDWHTSVNDDTERQVCIDVLCGYLATVNPTYREDDEEYTAHPGTDAAVRVTILHLLSRHRASDDSETSWENARYDLQEADLRSLRVQGLNLSGANLAGAYLADVDFSGLAKGSGAILTGANLTGAILTRAQLRRAQLAHATLDGAHLEGANLYRANLSRAHLYSANLYRASLDRAVLTETDLVESNLARADLTRCDLSGALVKGASLVGARLRDTNLDGANIAEADFAEATFDAELHIRDDPDVLMKAKNADKAINLHLAAFTEAQRLRYATLIDRARNAAQRKDTDSG
ncbi:pentapeptide repeat-containing protein [Mycolicibacterium mageritense]|uniref:pentapeptide repeat-containing protein n=1 Tax=Mycolicibacterium mageritense TaxID=53462 RepID=UPI001E5CDAF7|nr:pentapeptide repeat-containing protein [Mycolicibacterium mageritense]